MPALGIPGHKPVEAAVRFICALLFGYKQREAIALGERRPSRTVLIIRRSLRAAVENDHKRGSVRKAGGQIGEHAQGPWIGAKTVNFVQEARRLAEVGGLQPDLGGRSHERLPLLPIVEQGGSRFSKTEH
jgi:hypothetical protein